MTSNDVYRAGDYKMAMHHNVVDDEVPEGEDEATLTQTSYEVLAGLRYFWERIWDRTEITDDQLEALQRTWGPGFQQRDLPLPDGETWLRYMYKQRGKSAGVDGWRAEELVVLPLDHWNLLATAVASLARRGALPRDWGCIRQARIVKPNKAEALVYPMSALRPVSIMTVWYRAWVSAIMTSQDAKAWQRDVLPPEQVGGKADEDVLAALVPVAQWSKTHYMATLDYSKAFDYSSPRLVVAALVWCGMPSFLAHAIGSIWKNQTRWLTWHGSYLVDGVRISQSLPQGDPASPMGLNAVLSFAVRMLKNNWPNTKNLLFLDDRSWASPTPGDAVQVLHAWHEFSESYGLGESFSKSQFFARTAAMRRRFEAVLGEVRDNIVLIGVSFRGARNRAMTSKEQSRIQRATNIACKASILPDYSGKLHVVTQMACSAASWGWIFRPPNVKTCRAFEVAWRRAGLAPTRSNVAMGRPLLGHVVDLNFVSGTMALSALMRAARQQRNIDRTSVIFKRVSTWMQKLGWRYLRLSLLWKREDEYISLRDDIEGAKHKLAKDGGKINGSTGMLLDGWKYRRRVSAPTTRFVSRRLASLRATDIFWQYSAGLLFLRLGWRRRVHLRIALVHFVEVSGPRVGIFSGAAPTTIVQWRYHKMSCNNNLVFHRHCVATITIGRFWNIWPAFAVQ